MEYEDSRNIKLAAEMETLRGLLLFALSSKDINVFNKLRTNKEFPKFTLPDDIKDELVPPDLKSYLKKVPEPTFIDKLIPGWRKLYQIDLNDAEKLFLADDKKFKEIVAKRNKTIDKLREQHKKDKELFELTIQKQNQKIEMAETAYRNGDLDAITNYYSTVLKLSKYPSGFPKKIKVAYAPNPKELVVEYELPTIDIIPNVAEYRYIKTRGTIQEKPRKKDTVARPPTHL